MSKPTSTKMWPPNYIDGKVRRRYFHVYLIQMWISLLPTAFLCYWFFLGPSVQYSFQELVSRVGAMSDVVFYILIPPIIIIIYIVTVIWTALVTKIRLIWLNILHKPVEGIFLRDMKDKDYVYWNKRNYARLFLNWLLFTFPFTMLKKTFGFRFLGVHIGKNAEVNQCWLSQEFVSIGNNVKVGQAAAIYSFMYENDKLLVAKVKIEDNAYLGPQCVIFPGSVIGDGAVIDGGSWGHPFTKFEPHGVYHGTPAELIRKEAESSENK